MDMVLKNPIDKTIAHLEEKIKVVEGHRAIYDRLGKFSFEGFDISWGVGYDVGTVMGLLLHVDNVDDLEKIQSLVVRLCVFLGCKAKSTEDYADARRRTIYFDNGLALLVFLRAGEGAKCKFVQVGEELKPIYEIRCEEKKDSKPIPEPEVEKTPV